MHKKTITPIIIIILLTTIAIAGWENYDYTDATPTTNVSVFAGYSITNLNDGAWVHDTSDGVYWSSGATINATLTMNQIYKTKKEPKNDTTNNKNNPGTHNNNNNI